MVKNMSHHMEVVYKHVIISIIFTTFHMTIAFPHITLICTSYLSLLTRKRSIRKLNNDYICLYTFERLK